MLWKRSGKAPAAMNVTCPPKECASTRTGPLSRSISAIRSTTFCEVLYSPPMAHCESPWPRRSGATT